MKSVHEASKQHFETFAENDMWMDSIKQHHPGAELERLIEYVYRRGFEAGVVNIHEMLPEGAKATTGVVTDRMSDAGRRTPAYGHPETATQSRDDVYRYMWYAAEDCLKNIKMG